MIHEITDQQKANMDLPVLNMPDKHKMITTATIKITMLYSLYSFFCSG
jgi:hypothetical protein